MGTFTPWGEAHGPTTKIADGIILYSTETGDSGIKLSQERNDLIPEYMRHANSWYDDKREWVIPAIIFPTDFDGWFDNEPGQITTRTSMYKWFPDHYKKFVKGEIKDDELFIREMKLFKKRNKDNYVSLSAILHETGKLLVTASLGGERDIPTKNFLVHCTEYFTRGKFGFVIDPYEHKEV